MAGILFPSFGETGFWRVYRTFASPNQWAKLLVWAFLAGFSERLMPDLLDNVAKKINDVR